MGVLDRSIAALYLGPAARSARGREPGGGHERRASGSRSRAVRICQGRWQPPGHRCLHGSDFTLAVAFVAPYAALFFAFAVYPIGYALWMGNKPSLHAELIADPLYLPSMLNTCSSLASA